MDKEQLKALWAILGGSTNQDVSDAVFETAARYLEMQGWDIMVDPQMDPGDLVYQEWNPWALAIVSVLDALVKGRLIPAFADLNYVTSKPLLPPNTY